ncbi:flagellar assembly protein FliH [Chromobacterium amazonense]|uniref:flagellar assembly protein FliH n=1 Tax=Chromobacterium amazonense TaxID=1382803 RepID=UPI0031F64FF3
MAYQRYKFPLLVQAEVNQEKSDDSLFEKDYQLSVDDGFQQGMEQGYQVGYEKGKAEGWSEGVSLGKEEGFQQASSEVDNKMNKTYLEFSETLDSIISSMKKQQEIHAETTKSELIELVRKVARQVIRCELTLMPAQMVGLIEEAILTLPASLEEPQVYLNSQDYNRIKTLISEQNLRWQLIEDTDLKIGECRVILSGNEVDAGCEHRLDACITQLSSQLGSE